MALFGLFGKKKNEQEAREKERIEAEAKSKVEAEAKAKADEEARVKSEKEAKRAQEKALILGVTAFEEKNIEGAIRHWKELADSGHLQAMINMAQVYAVKQDSKNSAEWLKEIQKREAELNDEQKKKVVSICNFWQSYYKMAETHNKGIALYKENNYTEAIKYLQNSAENGMLLSQRVLAKIYLDSEFDGANEDEAYKWIEVSAEMGDMNAQYRLGKRHIYGFGKVHNPEKGLKWISVSAKQGNPDAEYELASLYFDGLKVDQDLEQAYELCKSAKEHGVEKANELLNKIEESLAFLNNKEKAEMEYELGMNEEKKGNFNDAMNHYTRVTELCGPGDSVGMKVGALAAIRMVLHISDIIINDRNHKDIDKFITLMNHYGFYAIWHSRRGFSELSDGVNNYCSAVENEGKVTIVQLLEKYQYSADEGFAPAAFHVARLYLGGTEAEVNRKTAKKYLEQVIQSSEAEMRMGKRAKEQLRVINHLEECLTGVEKLIGISQEDPKWNGTEYLGTILKNYKYLTQEEREMIEKVVWGANYLDIQITKRDYYYREAEKSKNKEETQKWKELGDKEAEKIEALFEFVKKASYNIDINEAKMMFMQMNYSEAFKIYSEYAEEGDAYSQYMVGLLLIEGKGVAKNKEEGIQWLKKAAAQGDENAQKVLAKIS